jgi:hypothetical protein
MQFIRRLFEWWSHASAGYSTPRPCQAPWLLYYSDELIQLYESLPNLSLSEAFSCAYPSSYMFDSHVLSIGTFIQVAFEWIL